MQIPPEIWHAPDLFLFQIPVQSKTHTGPHRFLLQETRISPHCGLQPRLHPFHPGYRIPLMIRRFFREIFRRRLMNIIFASAISPIPPICIRHRITAFPMGLHWTAITSCGKSRHTYAGCRCKNSIRKVTACPGALQNGSHKINPPTKITPAKPRAIICDVFSLCNPSETFFKFINIIFCNYEK